MQRVESKQEALFLFDLTNLQPDKHAMLAQCLHWCVQNNKTIIPRLEIINTSLLTSTKKKIVFSLEQEILFYRQNPSKAFVLGRPFTQGMFGEIVDVISTLRLSDELEIMPKKNLLAKKFFSAKEEDRLVSEASLASRLSYLRPVKGAFIYPALYGDYKRALLVMHKVMGENLESYVAVDGESFQQTNARPLSASQRLRLISALIRATQLVHEALIIHRDFAPKNLLVTIEPYCRARWVDLGLASNTTRPDGRLRQGTPIYFSSQATHAPQTQADDLFAAGIIASQLLCADESHAEQAEDVAILHANYQFYNLFKFLQPNELTVDEKVLLHNFLKQFTSVNPLERFNLNLALNVVEEIEHSVLRRTHPNNVAISAAFYFGKIARETFLADKLSDWLDFPGVVAALKRFANILNGVSDDSVALRVFIEKAEFGPLITHAAKASMMAQINGWCRELESCEQQWKELQRLFHSKALSANARNNPAWEGVKEKFAAFEHRFRMRVHWDELPQVLESLAKKWVSLQKELTHCLPPVRRVGLFGEPNTPCQAKSRQKRPKNK